MLQSKTKVGELDREITFIQAIIAQGVSNEDKKTGWELIDTDPNVNAKKIEEGGSTAPQADRITYSKQTTWVIRWRNDLNVRMRLVWDTQVYEILTISDADLGRHRFMNVVTTFMDNEFFT